MRRIIKKIIQFFGFEIKRKRFTTENVSRQIESYLGMHRNSMEAALVYIKARGYSPDNIIDVGAGGGTAPLLNVFPEARHLLFEPLIEFEPELQKLKESYNLEYRICAIGESMDKVSINVHPDLYGSSFLKEQDGAIADGLQREVGMISLQTVNDLFKIGQETTLLIKLDVQGAELQVLQSGELVLQKADIVIIECSFFKFLINAPDITDIIFFMKNHGFIMYEMFDFHNRPYDNALAQADVIFVKENGTFRTTNNWATKHQRESSIV